MPWSYLVASMYVEQSEFAQAALLMWPQGPGPVGQPVVPCLYFVSGMHVEKRDGHGSAGTTGCCAMLTFISVMHVTLRVRNCRALLCPNFLIALDTLS